MLCWKSLEPPLANKLYIVVPEAFFPIYVVHEEKKLLKETSNKLDFNGDLHTIEQTIKKVKKNPKKILNDLIKTTILPENLFKIDKTEIKKDNFNKYPLPFYGDFNFEIISKFYQISIKAILQTSKTNKKQCLLIYFEGHEGHPFWIKAHDVLSKHTLSNNCDILTFSMLGLGLNQETKNSQKPGIIASFPSSINKNLNLNSINATNHGNYAFYYDEYLPNYDPISLFLSGYYYLIKSVISNYNNISIFGFSGGGWYANWFGAILPEVYKTISYSGSLPQGYMQKQKNHGDWEQTYSNIYKKFNYWTLYTLGTLNNKDLTRKNYLVYNDYDDICYTGEDVFHFKKLVEKFDVKDLLVIVIENDKHSIVMKPIFELLNFKQIN